MQRWKRSGRGLEGVKAGGGNALYVIHCWNTATAELDGEGRIIL